MFSNLHILTREEVAQEQEAQERQLAMRLLHDREDRLHHQVIEEFRAKHFVDPTEDDAEELERMLVRARKLAIN